MLRGNFFYFPSVIYISITIFTSIINYTQNIIEKIRNIDDKSHNIVVFIAIFSCKNLEEKRLKLLQLLKRLNQEILRSH